MNDTDRDINAHTGPVTTPYDDDSDVSPTPIPCEGMSDDCTLVATETRDTSDGHLALTHYCHECAIAYDQYIDNYDGPGDAF